jgi:hypothetical protein
LPSNWRFSEGIDFHSQYNNEQKGPALTFQFSFLVLGRVYQLLLFWILGQAAYFGNCKTFVQSHIFAPPPPDRRPKEKYPLSTLHCYRFVYKSFIAVLFGSNSISYNFSTQSDMCVCTHVFHNTGTLVGQKNAKFGTALNVACQKHLSA